MKSTPITPLLVLSTLTAGILSLGLAGCSVSDQKQESAKFPVTAVPASAAPSQRQQLKAVRTYAKTTFRLVAIEDAQLAGLDVQPRAGTTLAPDQLSQLTAAAGRADNVPLHLRLRLEARNPNRTKVMLNQLEYLVLVNNREVASGSTDDVLEIGPRSTLSIPLTVNANAHEALTDGLTPAALAAALNNWNQQPSRLSVRVRPTFQNATGRAFRTTGFEPIMAGTAAK